MESEKKAAGEPAAKAGERGLKRLELTSESGWYEYGRIPYKIFYDLEAETGVVDEKTPGRQGLTQDYPGPGTSLSIWVHVSVPKNYKDIIMYHELVEAEATYADGEEMDAAHQKAVIETHNYARANLSEEEYRKFVVWEKTKLID